MRGAHGCQPEQHEHVRCRFCNANGVHVQHPQAGWVGDPTVVFYGPHAVKGGTVACLRSRGHVVDGVDRHQGDPL